MRAAYLKICRLLASSGFREQEIAEFAQAVTHTDPRALIEDVTQLRRLIGDSLQGRILDITSGTSYAPTCEVEEKIERLLIHDAGLPRALIEATPDGWLQIPMLNAKARSLNLSNCVAIVLFEALRQTGFSG